MNDFDPLAEFWDQLLSRQPKKIRAAYQRLDQTTRQAVVAHLRRMASESGWHPEQRTSARSALEALHISVD